MDNEVCISTQKKKMHTQKWKRKEKERGVRKKKNKKTYDRRSAIIRKEKNKSLPTHKWTDGQTGGQTNRRMDKLMQTKTPLDTL